MKLLKNSLILVLIGGLLACAQQPEKLHTVQSTGQGTELFSASAGVRNLVLKAPSSSVYCAEPAPDATLDEADSIGFALSLFSKGNDAETNDSDTAEGSLGGRSVNVLLTREIFYRLCELYMNTGLSDEDKVDLFKTTLDVVAQMNSTDLGVGTKAATSVTLDNSVSASHSAPELSGGVAPQGSAADTEDTQDNY